MKHVVQPNNLDKLEKGLPLDDELQKLEQFQKQHQMVVGAIKENNHKVINYLDQLGLLFESVNKARNNHRLSYEYLASVLGKAREYLPPHLFDEIHRFSRAHAGGKLHAYSGETKELEKAFLEIEKRHLKPFSSPGGKDVWVSTLLKYTPEHTTYVEPYAGSASLFFAKELSEKSVLSEVNKQLTDSYKFLQKASNADLQWLRDQKWNSSEHHFHVLLKREARSPREKIYKFKYLNLHSYRGGGKNFNKNIAAVKTGQTFLANLENFRERLKNTSILNQDAIAVMRRYDGPNTFFYLDPPWKPITSGKEWRDFDEKLFVETVKGLKGKVLISYQGKPDLGPRFKSRSYTKNQFGNAAGNESRQTLYYNFNKLRKSEAECVDPDMALALAALGLLECTQDPPIQKVSFEFSEIKKSESSEEDYLWEWSEEKVPLQVEPLPIGSRLAISKIDGELNFHQENKSEFLSNISDLKDLLLSADRDFILDGFITKSSTVHGESLPVFIAADILFLDKDLKDQPLSKRKHLLKNFFSAYLLGSSHCDLMPTRAVSDRKQFQEALEWAETRPGSTGSILRSTADVYGKECLSCEKGPDFDLTVEISKVDEDKQIAYGVVLEPETEDAQGDRISAEDIETAFTEYMKNSQTIGLNHKQVAKEVKIVEAVIIKNDQTIFGEPVKKGSWWFGLWIPDNLWPDVKSGKITGLSIGGTGIRTSVKSA